MTTSLLRRLPPDSDASLDPDDKGFIDCRGVWQVLEPEEPVDAGS